jgi:hypothetical protein
MLVLGMWRADPHKAAAELAELIASLPEGMRSTLTEAAARLGRTEMGQVMDSGEAVDPETARGMSEELAEAARSRAPGDPAYDENRMLVRLVREAIFHRDSERRHLASLLIASSPFACPLTEGLLQLLGTRRVSAPVRRRAATLVRYLGEDTHRLRMLGLVDDPDEAVGAVLVQGVGHLPYTPFSDQIIRASLGEQPSSLERGKMYALGMSGSPGLHGIVRSSTAPPWQRAAAGWWIRQGPALRA